MQLKWVVAGILLVGLIICPAQAGWFDWLFGTETQSSSVVNISEGAWPNGTATIESLDTTTGDVTIHYTMEYVPSEGGVTIELFDNSSTDFPVWSGDACKLEGTWKFNLGEVNANPAHGYSVRLHKNEGFI